MYRFNNYLNIYCKENSFLKYKFLEKFCGVMFNFHMNPIDRKFEVNQCIFFFLEFQRISGDIKFLNR